MTDFDTFLENNQDAAYAYLNPIIITKVNNPDVHMLVGALVNPYIDTELDYINSLDENLKLDILKCVIEVNALQLTPSGFLHSFTDPAIIQEVIELLRPFDNRIVKHYKYKDTYPKLAKVFRTNVAYIDNIDEITTYDEALQCICSDVVLHSEVLELYRRFRQNFTEEDICNIIKNNVKAAYTLCEHGFLSFERYMSEFCKSDRMWDFLNFCLNLPVECMDDTAYRCVLHAIIHMPYSFVEVRDRLQKLEDIFNAPLRAMAYITCTKREPYSITHINICKEFTREELIYIIESGVLIGGSLTLEEFSDLDDGSFSLYYYLDYNNIRIYSGKLTKTEALEFIGSPAWSFYLKYIQALTNKDNNSEFITKELVNSKICSIAISEGLLDMNSNLLGVIDVDDYITYLY